MKMEKRQKFSIRKFSIGVASVIVGQFYLGSVVAPTKVKASEQADAKVSVLATLQEEASLAEESAPAVEAASEKVEVHYQTSPVVAEEVQTPTTESKEVATETSETGKKAISPVETPIQPVKEESALPDQSPAEKTPTAEVTDSKQQVSEEKASSEEVQTPTTESKEVATETPETEKKAISPVETPIQPVKEESVLPDQSPAEKTPTAEVTDSKQQVSEEKASSEVKPDSNKQVTAKPSTGWTGFRRATNIDIDDGEKRRKGPYNKFDSYPPEDHDHTYTITYNEKYKEILDSLPKDKILIGKSETSKLSGGAPNTGDPSLGNYIYQRFIRYNGAEYYYSPSTKLIYAFLKMPSELVRKNEPAHVAKHWMKAKGDITTVSPGLRYRGEDGIERYASSSDLVDIRDSTSPAYTGNVEIGEAQFRKESELNKEYTSNHFYFPNGPIYGMLYTAKVSENILKRSTALNYSYAMTSAYFDQNDDTDADLGGSGDAVDTAVLRALFTDANRYQPTTQTQTVNLNAQPNPADAVTNKGSLPNGTTYGWKAPVPTNTVGDKQGTVVVTYPDKTVDEVPATVKVVDNRPDKDKYQPTTAPVTTNINTQPNPADAVTNKGSLPNGTTYGWKAPVPTDTAGDKPATVVVTYPDKTVDEVPATVKVVDNRGEKGDAGKSFHTGSTPPSSGLGNNGDTYLNYITGEIYIKTDDVWTPVANIKGPKGDKGDTGAKGDKGDKGDKGADGKSVLTGTTTPSNNEGNDGDVYVDTATGDLYTKANGTWSKASNLKGPKGDTGAQGAKGDKGDKGDSANQNGGTNGNQNGGTNSNQNGGTNGNQNGGTNGNQNGGTNGNQNGGTNGNQNGGTNGNQNGGTNGNQNGGKVSTQPAPVLTAVNGGELDLNKEISFDKEATLPKTGSTPTTLLPAALWTILGTVGLLYAAKQRKDEKDFEAEIMNNK